MQILAVVGMRDDQSGLINDLARKEYRGSLQIVQGVTFIARDGETSQTVAQKLGIGDDTD